MLKGSGKEARAQTRRARIPLRLRGWFLTRFEWTFTTLPIHAAPSDVNELTVASLLEPRDFGIARETSDLNKMGRNRDLIEPFQRHTFSSFGSLIGAPEIEGLESSSVNPVK